VEWTGHAPSVVQAGCAHIFNKDQFKEMEERIGKSVYFNHLFTELVKVNPESKNFSDLLDLDDPYFKQIKLEFEHRIHKLMNHPKLGHLVDQNKIDFVIIQVLEALSHRKDV
jgi:hypothetical protein